MTGPSLGMLYAPLGLISLKNIAVTTSRREHTVVDDARLLQVRHMHGHVAELRARSELWPTRPTIIQRMKSKSGGAKRSRGHVARCQVEGQERHTQKCNVPTKFGCAPRVATVWGGGLSHRRSKPPTISILSQFIKNRGRRQNSAKSWQIVTTHTHCGQQNYRLSGSTRLG